MEKDILKKWFTAFSSDLFELVYKPVVGMTIIDKAMITEGEELVITGDEFIESFIDISKELKANDIKIPSKRKGFKTILDKVDKGDYTKAKISMFNQPIRKLIIHGKKGHIVNLDLYEINGKKNIKIKGDELNILREYSEEFKLVLISKWIDKATKMKSKKQIDYKFFDFIIEYAYGFKRHSDYMKYCKGVLMKLSQSNNENFDCFLTKNVERIELDYILKMIDQNKDKKTLDMDHFKPVSKHKKAAEKITNYMMLKSSINRSKGKKDWTKTNIKKLLDERNLKLRDFVTTMEYDDSRHFKRMLSDLKIKRDQLK